MPRRITDDGPLVEFFAQYPDYHYDHSKGPTKNFRLMCRVLGFIQDSDEKTEAKQAFEDALTMEFNKAFGTEENNLESWQSLCERIKVDPIPDTLEECRKIVEETHVNLVDLIDKNEENPRIFDSVEELKNYCVREHKFFPKENAYAGGLLRYLLREFFNAHRGRRGQGRRGRGAGRARRGRQ
ncbi:hypothetical protein JR316_0002802 [Psilocybe cubensis]|uniref:Uncharacterized protein n=1 Tax=Psilocybe cubensis TaxID=181762 RepID=A0ACB8HE00_PSICU|nr:hypothetical protein JR316_0002802 [Psilocybe cubensis]KAH9485887.1 hypothetical protein JR316_0002802 [Psilocybe cubensis]